MMMKRSISLVTALCLLSLCACAAPGGRAVSPASADGEMGSSVSFTDSLGSTITLEEALELFKLPRTLGEYEGKTVSVGVGRFGPYIQHNKVYVSLPKTLDPMKVTLEEAEQLILEKRAKEAERHIKKFDEEPELEILNGRYGPYIAYKGNNYKIPKDIIPQDLSLKSCLELVKIQDEKGPSTSAKGKRTAKKK